MAEQFRTPWLSDVVDLLKRDSTNRVMVGDKDFVLVVRCKDCKFFDHSDFGEGEEYWCKRFVSSFDDIRRCHRVTEDDYCAWGKRREDNA